MDDRSHGRIPSDLLKPMKTVLTPTSTNSSVLDLKKVSLSNDIDTESLLLDKDFFKAAAINNVKEIVGKEKSLLALRGTYKNIDKAE